MHAAPAGLREPPFGEVAHPARFYASPVHETVCAELLAALQAHRGLVLLTGEPGTGKTMVLRRVIRDLAASGGRVLRCDDPAVLDRMLAWLARQLNVPDATTRAALEEGSVTVDAEGPDGATVVAVDEAQRLEPMALARLCSLTEAWPDAGRPVAVLLVGQPDLAARLANLERQGSARPLHLVLPPLPASEVGLYVAHQLDEVEGHGGAVFESDAIARVAAHADGVPRVINNLCAGALRAASQAHVTTVSAPMVDGIARQLDAPFVRGRAVRLGDGVARGLTEIGDGAVAFGRGVAQWLRAAHHHAPILSRGVAHRLLATGRYAAIVVGRGVADGVRVTGRHAGERRPRRG